MLFQSKLLMKSGQERPLGTIFPPFFSPVHDNDAIFYCKFLTPMALNSTILLLWRKTNSGGACPRTPLACSCASRPQLGRFVLSVQALRAFKFNFRIFIFENFHPCMEERRKKENKRKQRQLCLLLPTEPL